jgi:mannitol-1-phosphate 5-dehydrogenase
VKKIVIFGAGRIGRSFIGQIFSRGGFEVVFVDIDRRLIDLINDRKNYKIIIKGEKDETLLIQNVRGIHFDDSASILNEISSTSILGVSVGQAALPRVIPLIAKSLTFRAGLQQPEPLDIIIAENMRDAAGYFRKELLHLLGNDFPVDKLAGLIETSIGKMVPFMTREDLKQDPLQIFAEPYNTLILDKKGFRNPVPDIPWLAPEENMKAWVDRKSFIHNLGHAAAAYIGFLKNPEIIYMSQILEDRELFQIVRSIMLQSAAILHNKYPEEFTTADLEEHIDDLLSRFRNKALKDTVFRVGCDLNRKLGPDDRLIAPIMEAILTDLNYNKILYALVCGFYFRAKDETGHYYTADLKFYNNFKPDIEYLLTMVCQFDPLRNNELYRKARIYCKVINKQYKPEVSIL